MVIRNEQGVSMSSVEGELIVVLLTSEGQLITQQPVRVTVADAIFANLPPGRHTVIARHPALSPTESRQDIVLSDRVMLGIKYIYAEAERRLLRIEVIERPLDV